MVRRLKQERPRSLTEGEIQRQLYGQAKGSSGTQAPAEMVVHPEEPIRLLAHELEVLRSDVEGLRQRLLKELKEKDRLEQKFSRLRRFSSAAKERRRQHRPARARDLQRLILGTIALVIVLPLVLVASWQLTHRPPQPSPPPHLAREAEAPYTIQVATVERRGDALRLADQLRLKGYQVSVDEYLSAKGRPYFRLFVGSFKSPGEAQATLQQLRVQEGLKDSFVRRSKSSPQR